MEAEACGFPHARQLLCLRKESFRKKSAATNIETRYFITSIEPGELSPQRLAALVRGHWGVENRNHWRRDASRWREDGCRLRRTNAAFNLALLRNALLALVPSADFPSLDSAFDYYHTHPAAALALLQSPPIIE